MQELTHNRFNGATGGIWRVPHGDTTAVLKLATPGRPDAPEHFQASLDPGHWNYWLRERLAYESGLAGEAYPGLAAPRLLETRERPDGSVELWLQDVTGTPGTDLGVADLGDIAYRTGVAHARWLHRPPAEPWLARDFLTDYTTAQGARAGDNWEHPAVTAAWSPSLRADLHTLWVRRERLLAEARALPRTLCHHDLWPLNLILADDGPVLLDWAFAGPGAIGEDVANLALDTFFDGLVDIALIDDVIEAVVDGYVRGLDGAVGTDTVVHAIKLTGAVKYHWLAPRMLTAVQRGLGGAGYDPRGLEEMLAGRAPVLARLAAWSSEVLS